jgi:hypothetical protein
VKRLEEYLQEALNGEVETITATDLRKHIGECLTMVSMGKSYIIKRKGKTLAYLTLSEDLSFIKAQDEACDDNS